MRYPLLEKIARGRTLTDISVKVRLPRPTARLDLVELVMRFDRVTNDMIEAFANGECTILATAMHQVTGWDYINVVGDCEQPYCWHHIGVDVPGGRFGDIRGLRAYEQAGQPLPGERSVPRKKTMAARHPGTTYWFQKANTSWLFDNRFVPRSGRVGDFALMHGDFDPLLSEAVLLLAERIVARGGLPVGEDA